MVPFVSDLAAIHRQRDKHQMASESANLSVNITPLYFHRHVAALRNAMRKHKTERTAIHMAFWVIGSMSSKEGTSLLEANCLERL